MRLKTGSSGLGTSHPQEMRCSDIPIEANSLWLCLAGGTSGVLSILRIEFIYIAIASIMLV